MASWFSAPSSPRPTNRDGRRGLAPRQAQGNDMQNWRALFDAALVDRFLITIEDAGLDEFELRSWERDYPEDP